MNDMLDERELCAFTRQDPSIALAELIDGLEPNVYADGEFLIAPWISRAVAETIDSGSLASAILTTRSRTRYFLLRHSSDDERFELVRGPLTGEELRAELLKARGVGA